MNELYFIKREIIPDSPHSLNWLFNLGIENNLGEEKFLNYTNCTLLKKTDLDPPCGGGVRQIQTLCKRI